MKSAISAEKPGECACFTPKRTDTGRPKKTGKQRAEQEMDFLTHRPVGIYSGVSYVS